MRMRLVCPVRTAEQREGEAGESWRRVVRGVVRMVARVAEVSVCSLDVAAGWIYGG